MKKIRNFIFYLTYCIFPLAEVSRIPDIIRYRGKECYSILTEYADEWKLTYETNLSSYAREIVLETRSGKKYLVHFKMLWLLWKNRKDVDFNIYQKWKI